MCAGHILCPISGSEWWCKPPVKPSPCFTRPDRTPPKSQAQPVPPPLMHTCLKPKEISQWTPETLKSWARTPHCLVWVRDRLNEVKHPQQVSRRCLGVLRLSEIYGNTRLTTVDWPTNTDLAIVMLVNDGDRTASEQCQLAAAS